MPGSTSKRSDHGKLTWSDLSDRPEPPPADVLNNEALREVADGYTDVLGAALIEWLRANRDVVRAVLDDE